MIMLKKRYYLGIALYIFSLPLLSQEKETAPISEVKIIESKDIPLDSMALPLLEAKPINLIKASDAIKDNSLAAVTKDNTAKYDLKDLENAAKYDSLWMKELLETNALFEDMYEEVTTLDPDKTYETEINTDSLKARLERLNQRTPFNIAYNPSLENVIKSFLNRKRGLMERMLTVSQFYFPLFEEQLDNYDIPLEMKYLSIVESALNPKARSRVGATGLWQFMYSTGKMYKLDVSSYVDERSDPIKATEAACKYLGKLYDIFEDWDLALAAYNSGPGNVNKAIRRSGGYKNYWNIRRNLPRETAGYVPAFIATMYLFEYAEEYGLKAKEADRTYFVTDTVHVKSLITFKQISELVGVDTEEIKLLNPSYKLDVIPFIEGKNYSLRLPVAALGKFVANEKAIYAHVKEELKSKESPLPKLVKAQDQIRYKVRSGDYLGKIASRYGVGVSQIKRWNGLRSNNLRIGQRLTIFTKNPAVVSSKKPKRKSSGTANLKGVKTHTVKSGDSLWTISKKYPGISIENLREWNGISGNNLKPGTKLKLCDCSS
ncbi:LysM peptidoglycan-binding domain-containing protein [uncultured Maribacter sp.]|uniref:LysM peptidoglycan-binding domain-containing protein n=1 Tax=uncultured Maribacter sp. TaxID=431308 RepID=UPI00263A168F|nr:LysM peptidoglycan-binding domain-containing protein [uncultured Maribacter sp.]